MHTWPVEIDFICDHDKPPCLIQFLQFLKGPSNDRRRAVKFRSDSKNMFSLLVNSFFRVHYDCGINIRSESFVWKDVSPFQKLIGAFNMQANLFPLQLWKII